MRRNILYIPLSAMIILFLMLFTASFLKAENKDFCEYSPSISADGQTMIYQADFEKKDNFKIYIKHRLSDSSDGTPNWTDPVMLKSVNSKYLDGGCFITYDQNNLIITSTRAGGFGKADLWISAREGNNWTEPVNMGEPINSSGYEGFASLSPDGKTLYYQGFCPGKKLCKDNTFGIYTSVKKDGKWMTPELMPPPINSNYCEKGPLILADSVTLIFSSNRPGGKGDYDLYKSVKQPDGTWSNPENLGDFINTELEDSLVSIPASGDIMFYTKELKKGSDISRIYSAPIPEALRQQMVTTISGVVMDATNESKVLHANIKIIDADLTAEPQIVESNINDGRYIVILNKGKEYNIFVGCEGYAPYSSNINLKKLTKFQDIKQDILLEPIQVGTKIVLNDIEFKFRSHKLLASSKPELDKILNLMQDNPKIKIEISGHTDNVGSDKFNRKLSRERASSVREYLINKGIEPARMAAKGFGEAIPVADNETEEGRKLNRRVEIKIMENK